MTETASPSRDYLPHDPSSDEIKENIEQTRSRMDHTLDRLHSRIDFGGVVNDLKGFLSGDDETRQGAKRAARAVLRPVRENPAAAIALGASAIWFLSSALGDDEEDEPDEDLSLRPGRSHPVGDDKATSSSRGVVLPPDQPGSSTRSSQRDGGDGLAEKAKAIASGTQERLKEAAATVKDAASHAREEIGDALSSAGDGLKEGCRTARNQSRRFRRRGVRKGSNALRDASRHADDLVEAGKERYAQGLRENPLGMILGALGIGIVSAAVVPVTRREDELFGDASDEVTDRLKETGETLLAKGKRVGDRVLHAALDEAESAHLHPERLHELVEEGKEAVEEAMAHVAAEARDAAEAEGLTPAQLAQKAKAKTADPKTP